MWTASLLPTVGSAPWRALQYSVLSQSLVLTIVYSIFTRQPPHHSQGGKHGYIKGTFGNSVGRGAPFIPTKAAQ